MAESTDRKHYTMVFTGSGSAKLGADIVRLRYDKMVLVIEGMMQEAEKQQLADDGRGRPKLAAALRRLRDALRVTLDEAREVEAIAAPFNAKVRK